MTLDLPVPDIPVNSTRLTAAILRPRDDMPASQDIRVRGASGGQPPNRGRRADRAYLRAGRGPAPVAARDRSERGRAEFVIANYLLAGAAMRRRVIEYRMACSVRGQTIPAGTLGRLDESMAPGSSCRRRTRSVRSRPSVCALTRFPSGHHGHPWSIR